MWIIAHKKIFFGLSVLLVLTSLAAVGVLGLELGIDFTGGSIIEVSYSDGRPELSKIESALDTQGISGTSIREAGETGYFIRTPFLEEDKQSALVDALGGEVERLSSVGPTIGAELRSKAVIAIAVVVVAIILFIAFAFRKVKDDSEDRPQGPSSWRYGFSAIVALIHDIVIPAGAMATFGYFTGATIDVLFVMALLAILGFSVNDTIVVFDRVRENLKVNKEIEKYEPFDTLVGKSLSQTYVRSLNTSLTTLVVLLALFFVGGEVVHTFTFTLIVGVVAGTYSSIFLASPLLVVMAGKDK